MKRIALLFLLPVAALFGQTLVNYPTDIRGGPYASDAGPVGKTLPQLCTGAGSLPLALTQNWTTQTTQTIPCVLQGAGGIIRPSAPIATVQQVITLPCPASVPFPMFDTTLGLPGSIAFSRGCPGALDIRMFTAPGGDWGLALQAAYNACAPLGGCVISYPSGTFAHATAFTLTTGEPVQISGQGNGAFVSSTVAPTILTYSGMGPWTIQNAQDRTDSVVMKDFAFTCSDPTCQFAKVGSFNTDVGSWFRTNWVFSNLWIFGPGGVTAQSNPGMGLTQLIKCYMSNVIVLNFYQDIILDRSNGCQLDTVWFQNYSVGPAITWKAGSGSGAGYAAELAGVNVKFQGPGAGTGQYAVTIDHSGVKFFEALYEPTILSAGWIHNTSQGHDFSDFGGLFSGVTPTNSMVWDTGYGNIQLFGTSCPASFATCSTISAGTPNQSGDYITPGTFMGVSGTLYSQCLTVGNGKCQAIGGTPISYGSYTGITGPVRVDITNSGDGVLCSLMKAGATNDICMNTYVMPSSDQTASTTVRAGAVTESAGIGTNSAGYQINTGNQSSTARTVYFGSDGGVTFPRYAGATGAAGGKKVVCMDSATGKLYLSSTSTDCSN